MGSYQERGIERSRELSKRRKAEVLFFCSELRGMMVRLVPQKDAEVVEVCQSWLKDKTGLLALARKKSTGAECFSVRKLRDLSESGEGLDSRQRAIAGRLADYLDDDLTLSGKRSERTVEFVEKRREVSRQTAADIRNGMMRNVDFALELADEKTDHSFSDAEIRDKYLELQNHLQGVVDKIFKTSGLERFLPKVHVTRNKEPNAFVFSTDGGFALREYLQEAADVPIEVPIFVNVGLLKLAQNDDEMAFILSHEFAHLLQPSYLSVADDAEKRRLEYDADAEGMRLADAAGFNPRSAINFFRRLAPNEHQFRGMTTVIMGHAHPSLPDRVMELEKLFHRSDLPLPNASRRAVLYRQEITSALDFVFEHDKRIDAREVDLWRLELDGQLDEFLDGNHGAEIFLSMGFQKDINEVGVFQKKSGLWRQELAHDTLGYRTLLLTRLEGFAKNLWSLSSAVQDGKASVTIPLPNTIKEAADDILAAQKSEEWREPDQQLETLAVKGDVLATERKNLESLSSKLGLENFGAGLEMWLEEGGNEVVEHFWLYVAKQKGKKETLNRAERLHCLKHFLWEFLYKHTGDSFSAGQRPIFEIDLPEHKTFKVKRRIRKDKPSKIDRAESAVGLRCRFHKKEEGEYEDVEYEVSESESHVVDRVYAENLPIYYNAWKSQPEGQAPVVRKMTEALQSRTVEAFRDVLVNDGMEEPETNLLFFMLRSFGVGHNHLDDFQNISIAGLWQVVRILEKKNLAILFEKSQKQYGNQDMAFGARDQAVVAMNLRELIAFALRPANDSEKKIQEECRKDYELGLRGGTSRQPWVIMEHCSGDDDSRLWDRRCAKKDEGGRLMLDKPVYDNATLAVSERIWQGAVDEIKDLASAGVEILDEAGRDAVRTAVARLVRYRRRGVAKNSARMEELFSSFLLVFRDRMAHAYREGIVKTTTVACVRESETRSRGSRARGYASEGWFFVEPLVEETCLAMSEEFGGVFNAQDIRRSLMGIALDSFTLKEEMLKDQELSAMSVKRSQTATVAMEEDLAQADAQLWYGYRPQEVDLSSSLPIKERDFVNFLKARRGEPGVERILDFLKKNYFSKRRSVPEKFKPILMGFMTGFKEPGYGDNFDFSDLIQVWRLGKEVYGEKWKNSEWYKRLDEQLSVWEWVHVNPVFRLNEFRKNKVIKRVRGREKEVEVEESKPLLEIFDHSYQRLLEKIYKMDTGHIVGVSFSWPLFLQDVWDDAVPYERVDEHFAGFSDDDKKEETGKFRTRISALRQELERIVADEKNLPEIMAMQPGFFKEFLLDKKMKKAGVSSLEEIERWIGHFSSYSHEASKRNQMAIQIENVKQGVDKEKKQTLMVGVVQARYPEAIMEGSLEESVSLSIQDKDFGKDWAVRLSVYINHPSDPVTYSRIYDLCDDACYLTAYVQEVGDSNFGHQSDSQKDAMITKWSAVASDLEKDYCGRMQAEKTRVAGLSCERESRVMLFSDQVVEDNKSRLEIGPVYRLRWLSQPLMDWHAGAVAEARSEEELEAVFARVEHDLPEKHPLRDIFVRNQLNCEIWYALCQAIGQAQAEELGIKFSKADVDLSTALEKFPLHRDISFLRRYTLFELGGLIEAVDKLPEETAFLVRHKIEKALLERISDDEKSVLRRLLMEIERKIVWPKLREDVKTNPRAYDEYLFRIKNLYGAPSFERDDVLEAIGMDLAMTPEQIREIWGLRYAEEVRWPKQEEDVAVSAQFGAFEKMKGFIHMLDVTSRAKYFLWMLGGEEPLPERLSVERTGISLGDRREIFWGLTAVERRQLLFELLLGREGVMEKVASRGVPDSTPDNRVGTESPWPTWDRPSDMVRYVSDEMFKLIFRGQRLDDSLPEEHETNKRGSELLGTTFRELFVGQKDVARRAELAANVVEAFGSARKSGQEMNVGEVMRLLLEQIGVVGIKAGQVLSEQPGLLPEKIRAELAQLKDRTTPFSKRGVLTYVESAGLLRSGECAVTQMREIVGSASIKEVVRGVTGDGRTLALKAKRPSIEKNFSDDMEVLREIVRVLNDRGFKVPHYLLDEIERLVSDELSFVYEAENQRAMGESLRQRQAAIDLSFKSGHKETVSLGVSAPLRTNRVDYPESSEADDIGLMAEEFVRGASLKEMREFQDAVRDGDSLRIDFMRKRLADIYGAGYSVEAENRILDLDLDKLQSEMGLEFLREVVHGGIFHSDLHSGNFYLDVVPLLGASATFIDLGSAGCSKKEAMPAHVKGKYDSAFDGSGDFRDFLTALFGLAFNPGRCLPKVAELVGKYAGVNWSARRIQEVVGEESPTKDKVNKIFYALLSERGDKIEPQFRYLLKAVATAADHLDNLSKQVIGELAALDQATAKRLLAGEMSDDELAGKGLGTLGKIRKEQLINFDLLGLREMVEALE